MSNLDENKLTLEDLEADVTKSDMEFTATLHFEFSDILNAIEHIEQAADIEESEPALSSESESGQGQDEPKAEPGESAGPESEPGTEEPASEPESEESEPEPEIEISAESEAPGAGSESESEPASETEPEESELPAEPEIEEPAAEPEPEGSEPEPEPAAEPEMEISAGSELEPEPAAEPEVPANRPAGKLSGKDTKRLVIVDIILLLVIIASIAGGLVLANSLVDKANAAKTEKIAMVQENIEEVDLAESLRTYAADEVLEDMQVPTYTLDQLYALDLREKTGFTVEDLKIITTRGLVGCEKAFVEAEEKYGVNSIFLVSIASLESAYGTQMFRPNNMFGYGRTGFSSKSECIMTVASGLGNKYLKPGASLYGGSPTLKGVNKRYAANPKWYYKVGKYMQRYYNELAAAKNGNLEKFE